MNRHLPPAVNAPPMPVETTTWTFAHDGRPVTIPGIRSSPAEDARGSAKPVLVFENSWNIPPLPDYHELLDALDEHFNVVGLSKNGLNNLGSMEPRTIEGHAELTVSFCRWLRESGKAPSLTILGHSLGFATAYRAVTRLAGGVEALIGVAPLLPGKHSLATFFFRFIAMSIGMGALRSKGPRGQRYFWTSGTRYVARLLRKPLSALSLIADMARLRFEVPIRLPALIIAPYSDELVPWNSDSDNAVHETFPLLEWHQMTGRSHRHSLPLLYGQTVAGIVAERFGQRRRKSGNVALGEELATST